MPGSAAPEDAPVASLPVYLSASVPRGARVELFQYPLYARHRPLPVPATAAQRGQRIGARWRPHANCVEMDIPLDMREAVYNRESGARFAESSAPMGSIGAPGDDAVKAEPGTAPAAPLLDRMRLESTAIEPATRYMVGLLHDGALHLVPLDAVLQMRPSMQHVDLLSQADERQRRPAGADEEEAPRDTRRPGVVSLNVSMRSESMQGAATAATRYGAAQQRDAEAERWVPLRYEASTPEAAHALLAQRREPLVSTTHPREYL